MDRESQEYMKHNGVILTDDLKNRISKHAKRYNLSEEICAYYTDMKDFYSDWCAIGYSKTEAKSLLHGGIGEFMILPNKKGIIRFVI